MQHPVQTLLATDQHLVTASGTQLASFDAATNAPLSSSSTAHKALIRFLAPYTDPATGDRFLVSTGEDKLLVVSSLPSLEVVSTREIAKRANALDVTHKGEIVVGDKFGDVYIYPLSYTPPPPAPKGTPAAPKPQPILGHVSMLNTLALIPASPAHGLDKDWIATGDRDEHVRISRFPMGHVIEKYGWGSKGFVSSLLYLPPTASSPPFLLSAGADPTLQVFALPTAELVAQFDVDELLRPYIAVGPESPAPVPAGRRKDKKGKGRKGKGKGKQGEGEGEGEGEEKGEEEEMQVEEVEVEEEEQESSGGKELTKGLAVVKMVEVGSTRENGGVVVLAAGATALLYVPFSLLLPASAPSTATEEKPVPSLLPFAHPILDFTPLPLPAAADSACEFLVSLDVARPAAPGSAPSAASDAEPTPLARAALSPSSSSSGLALRALPTLTTDAVLLSSACAPLPPKSKLPIPTASLYPVLSLLHHPGDESFLNDPAVDLPAGADAAAMLAAGVGDGKPKGGKVIRKKGAKGASFGMKRDADGEPDAEGRVGKRAVGRAETLRRYEEARRKVEEGKGEGLTEGERAAVEEIEGEKKAETEGATVA
ncbi:hypothetical protein JCM10207_005847 [Rhodosporidiobolus poonsookiae]